MDMGTSKASPLFHSAHREMCFKFQTGECNDASVCKRRHCSIGCGTEGKPYNFCHCLQAKLNLSSLSEGSEGSQSANERSALVSHPPNDVKLSTTVRRLLLVAAGGSAEAVYLTPPAATWSRLRSSNTQGQPPLRSRSEPSGLSSLNPQQLERVRQFNREMEAVSWLAAQSARCAARRVKHYDRFSGVFSEAMSEMGPHRRGRLVSSKSWKVLVT